MAWSDAKKQAVVDTIKACLQRKLEQYAPEPASMPFHSRLLGEQSLALYKFIQSLNTTFGTAIYEPVALAIAQDSFKNAWPQYKAGDRISVQAQAEIQAIMDGLRTGALQPNKPAEIERIRRVASKGELVTVKPTRIDLAFQSHDGALHLCDIKTAKPNAGDFKEFKRTLLEWVAVALAENPAAEVHTFIAIPYNPYAPEPYQRWTIQNMLDLDHDLKVAEGFWNFIADDDIYADLLQRFAQAGHEMRDQTDDYFRTRFS